MCQVYAVVIAFQAGAFFYRSVGACPLRVLGCANDGEGQARALRRRISMSSQRTRQEAALMNASNNFSPCSRSARSLSIRSG